MSPMLFEHTGHVYFHREYIENSGNAGNDCMEVPVADICYKQFHNLTTKERKQCPQITGCYQRFSWHTGQSHSMQFSLHL